VLTSEEEGDIKGEVVFVQKHPPAGPIFIRGNITGEINFPLPSWCKNCFMHRFACWKTWSSHSASRRP